MEARKMKQHSELYDEPVPEVYEAAFATVSDLGYSTGRLVTNQAIEASTKRRLLNPHSVQPLQLTVFREGEKTKVSVLVGFADQRLVHVSVGDVATRRRAVREVFEGINGRLGIAQ